MTAEPITIGGRCGECKHWMPDVHECGKSLTYDTLAWATGEGGVCAIACRSDFACIQWEPKQEP